MKYPEKGARVWVQMSAGKKVAGIMTTKKVAGIVLDSAFSAEGDYMQCKVELLVVNPFSPAQQLLRQVYPKPLPSYKLTSRYEALPGEQ